jgi:hypothetical protein
MNRALGYRSPLWHNSDGQLLAVTLIQTAHSIFARLAQTRFGALHKIIALHNKTMYGSAAFKSPHAQGRPS